MGNAQCTVIAQNFAPGTTAADIEAVMVESHHHLLSCRIITSHPTIIAELILGSRVEADEIIGKFNNMKVCRIRFVPIILFSMLILSRLMVGHSTCIWPSHPTRTV